MVFFSVKSNPTKFTGYNVDGANLELSYQHDSKALYEWYGVNLASGEVRTVTFERQLKEIDDKPDEWAAIMVSDPQQFYINVDPPLPHGEKQTNGVVLAVNNNDSDEDGINDLVDPEVYGFDSDMRRVVIDHPWRMPVTVSVDAPGIINIYETKNKRYGNKLTGSFVSYNGTDDKQFWIEGVAPGTVTLTVTAPNGYSDFIRVNVVGIEILDVSGNSATELKVGKWENGFSGATPRMNFVDYDPDRFFILCN